MKQIIAVVGVAILVFAAVFTPLSANAAVKVSPAMDQCLRNAVMAYGLLNEGNVQQREQVLNNTIGLIEEHCINK